MSLWARALPPRCTVCSPCSTAVLLPKKVVLQVLLLNDIVCCRKRRPELPLYTQ